MRNKLKKLLGTLGLATLAGIFGAYFYIHFFSAHVSSAFTENSMLHIPVNQTGQIGLNGNQIQAVPAGFAGYSDANLPDFIKAADMTIHGVVHVKTIQSVQNNNFGNPFDFWGRQRPMQPQEGSGSGVIISADGYIVTNNHVINNSDNISITLNDNRTFAAKIIGTDPSTDLALLKIDEKNLPFVTYGNSDNVIVGEWVLAVGNPFNLTSTVTAGIVSAKARNIGILPDQYKIESFIQTDAAVNPGNSGGALVSL